MKVKAYRNAKGEVVAVTAVDEGNGDLSLHFSGGSSEEIDGGGIDDLRNLDHLHKLKLTVSQGPRQAR